MEGSPLSQYSYGNVETIPRIYVSPLPGAGYIFFLRMVFVKIEQICNTALYEKNQYCEMKIRFVNSNVYSTAEERGIGRLFEMFTI